MPEIASLGIAVDSSQAANGAVNLDALTASAERAEAATVRLGTGATSALKNTSFQTANVAAQFQDIAVQLSAGQSPFLIALQQGTQLSMALGEDKGLAGTLRLLRDGFLSVISPVSLATIGVIAFGGIAVQALGAIVPKAESATDALERHGAAIKDIVKGYEGAEKAASDYLAAAGRLPQGAVQSNLLDQAKQLSREAEEAAQWFKQIGPVLSGSLNGTDQQIGKLLAGFDANNISAGELVTKLTEIKNSDLGPLGFILKDKLLNPLTDAAQKISLLRSDLVAINFIAAEAAKDNDTQFALDQFVAGKRSAASFDIELQAIKARAPEQLAEIARKQKELELDGAKMTDARKQQEIDQAGAVAAAQANYAITESNRARLRAVNDNVAAAQTELDIVGKSVKETARLQFLREQMAAAEAEAAQRGGTVSPDVKKGIEAAATQYGQIQEQIVGAQMVIADETPWDTMQRKIKETGDLLADHAIDWRTYTIEVGRAAEEMVDSYGAAANDVLGNVSKFTDALGLEGQAAFETQKALSLARAVVSGGEAIVHSYNAGAAIGGPPVGAVFAGVAAAATAAQIASIASSTYQSKSVSSSTGSSASAAASAAAAAPPQQASSLNITIRGSGVLSVDDFAKQLAAGLADGQHPDLARQITVTRAA